MSDGLNRELSIGWIGAGRMGFAMATRLANAGVPLLIYNRTRSKAEPLEGKGCRVAEKLTDLAACDIVFSMVSSSTDLKEVLTGEEGVVSAADIHTRVFVDCSSVSAEASAEVRERLLSVGADLVACPVSGNPKVVKAGKAALVASGPGQAFEKVRPYLEVIAPEVSFVGNGEHARIVKICHNVFLGVVTQSIAELLVLAESAGVSRSAFLDFLNKSVMGSVFTRYKTPALVNLDYTTTFTPPLLRKDLDLGLSAARENEVPMPLAVNTREIVQNVIGQGYNDIDFTILLEQQAKNSGMTLRSEDLNVDDGLKNG